MKFRHALKLTALKLAGFHVFTNREGDHFIMGLRAHYLSRAIYIEEL